MDNDQLLNDQELNDFQVAQALSLIKTLGVFYCRSGALMHHSSHKLWQMSSLLLNEMLKMVSQQRG